MAKNKKAKGTAATSHLDGVTDYRFPEATRKNNPPAKIAAEGHVPVVPKVDYTYSPRRPPELRFDPTGRGDKVPELVAKAIEQKLTEAEAWTLAEALRVHEPWLEWAGKREAKSFAVDPVALHIHERVSTQAILRVAARQDVMRSLFADPEQEYNEAVQFYKHDVDWSNRLILGDSLQVMSSLARREDLAGKVQMIYIDPPYGIKFRSNFQPEIGNRDVKDKEVDLTREPEMVKAYRDTWTLGVHSYLTYLRDRLIVAKELLTDTGSIFVQMGDENLHLVRSLMDDVFGAKNSVVMLVVKKKSQTPITESINDYLLWYAKNQAGMFYRPLSEAKLPTDEDSRFKKVELPTGERRPVKLFPPGPIPADCKFVNDDYPVVSQDPSATRSHGFLLHGRTVVPGPNRHWTYDPETDMQRLEKCARLRPAEKTARGVIYWSDYDRSPLSNIWDFHGEPDPVYVVQTNRGIVERCVLMTTVPGDLVFDPTCGSGTTALVAEQCGRRWISTDTSRVAIAIARQQLLTAKYDYYRLRDEAVGVLGGFRHRTVPKVTLKAIAQNTNLDPIFAKHDTLLDVKLGAANSALVNTVSGGLRKELAANLVVKQKHDGKNAVTDADRRRWDLPPKGKGWQHWEVPFDTDPDYPADLKKAIEEYRAAWRARMDEVNACIAANAEQEELVDQPEVDRKITRVSGPFTVEAVQPPEMSLGDAIEVNTGQFAGDPEELGETFVIREVQVGESAQNVEAYLAKMVDLLKMDGVRFPDNKHMKFTRLDPIYASGSSAGIHAEGRWVKVGETDDDPNGDATVGVVFGPQYGPITAKMIEEVIRPAARRYEDLVFAGFSFDGPAQAVIDEGHPRLRMHLAHIRPDVNPGMNGLLKEQPGSQLFTVFGRPRTALDGPDGEGMYRLKMEGVDIYDPVTNAIVDTGATKVAAWFVDGDYDGRTFCITQAFFPDRSAW
ncbi:MAG: site-specific DNA-methyltransferase, partial [Bryobacteraceae bacterium]